MWTSVTPPAARLLPAAFLVCVTVGAQPGPVIRTGYHLTARPWKPLAIPRDRYLDAIEGVCRFSIRHQNTEGAIIDPFLKREHQYATPYFAYAAATLIHAGRARDLLPYGVKAMDHATKCFAGGNTAIPDQHGNFFIAPLVGALDLYAGHVPEPTLTVWRDRLKKPRREIQAQDATNNWETYVMKGEWMRVLAGLAGRADATAAIEEAWMSRQRERVAPEPWRVYHDRTSDPDTLSVEAVGRGNLLALSHLGYDGPSAREIRDATEAGSRLTLLLQDPSGQVPANGRTDDHVWVDVGYQLAFDVMAERRGSDAWLAGQFRHAAMLSFQSIARWRRTDGEWAGSYFVTKNHFDPEMRVGYQPASQYSNYNGSLMFHLAEAYNERASTIEEHPAPTEIGGYSVEMDPQFASAFANAGGMQIQVNLRGQPAVTHENRWTPLGVVRFARVGWDTRLGPSDGALTTDDGGVTFAPAFLENGRWLRLASLPARYEGVWSVDLVHPVLVRCAVDYRPKAGQSGPSFRNEFTVTPDGVFSVMRKTSTDSVKWGVTWPLLENDGRPLERSTRASVATTGYAGSANRQNFLAIGAAPEITPEDLVRSTYGDLRPLRVVTAEQENRTFIYPSGLGDPAAEVVRAGIQVTADGFRSPLGRVSGKLYAGRTSAGGFGTELDLRGDGKSDVQFSAACGFLLQLDRGKVLAVETDRAVTAEVQGRRLNLEAHTPVVVSVRSR
ncbi:MAG TPA: hypothetical protein VGH38_20890 [Bryobacteraceae bacterium]